MIHSRTAGGWPRFLSPLQTITSGCQGMHDKWSGQFAAGLQVHRSTWGTDDLFLGSYSYLDGEGTNVHVKELSTDVAGKLFFAGKAKA